MLKPMWISPACRKPDVTSRQYSWSMAIEGPKSAPLEITLPPVPPIPTSPPLAADPRKASTLIAMRT